MVGIWPVVATAGVVAVLGSAAGFARGRVTDVLPQTDCFETEGSSPRYNVLVLGESWASGGRLFPELNRAISRRLGGRAVRACGIGYSGRTTDTIAVETARRVRIVPSLFGGEAPNSVVLLGGVNDVIRHVGADAYVTNTLRIAALTEQFGPVNIVSVPRVGETDFNSSSIVRSLKREFNRYYNDGGTSVVVDKYRSALAAKISAAGLPYSTINYDDLISSYEANRDGYTSDGIHLTLDNFHRYGEFLGERMTLGN